MSQEIYSGPSQLSSNKELIKIIDVVLERLMGDANVAAFVPIIELSFVRMDCLAYGEFWVRPDLKLSP